MSVREGVGTSNRIRKGISVVRIEFSEVHVLRQAKDVRRIK